MSDRTLYEILLRDAESNYSPASAAAYREADDSGKDSESHAGKCQIIRELSRRFAHPIVVLDLGCGTGRYFHCVDNVSTLVGVDPALNMLQHARRPVVGSTRNVHLVRSSLQEVAFAPHSFDLTICVGVFGLWCPLDAPVLKRMAGMLRAHGTLFVTAVEYQPVPMTLKRRAARAIRPLLMGRVRHRVDARLREFTIRAQDAERLCQAFFNDVQVTTWPSPTGRVDVHCVMSHPKAT